MKTKFISFSVSLLFTANFFSQIKIFSGGSVTIGGTTPPFGITHQVIGDKIAFSATSSSISSSPLIVGQNAASSSPGFAFWGDHQTGIAHPATSVLAITIANSEKFRFNSSNQFLSVNTTSSTSTPDYSWNNDVNTGVYHPNVNDVLGFVAGGNEVMRINSSRQILNSNSSSSAGAPDYSWDSDANTGIFRAGTDILGFSTGGSERIRINASGNVGIATTNPSEKLHVVGNTILNGSTRFDQWTDVTVDWSGSYSSAVIYPETDWYLQLGKSNKRIGDAWTTHLLTINLTVSSDQNIKQNINYDISSAITKLKQLKPASYYLKSNAFPNAPVAFQNKMTSIKHYGFIAQDLLSVFPELLEQDENGIYGVHYLDFIPLLTNAVQTQQAQIDSLKEQLNFCCNKSNDRLITNPNEGGIKDERYNGNSFIKQNSPNPFSKETLIEFFIAEKNANSSVLVFDMNGKLLKTLKLEGTGKGSVIISANDFQPGMYYYSLIINNKEIDTKKMILTE